MYKVKVMCLTIFLCGCSSITKDVIEDQSNSQIGLSPSHCNQVAMNCQANPANPTRGGTYTEWVNPDGSVGCACQY